MRIIANILEPRSHVLPLQCDCGVAVLHRLERPEDGARCPACGAEDDINHLITKFLIETDPEVFRDTAEIDYESLEIQGD